MPPPLSRPNTDASSRNPRQDRRHRPLPPPVTGPPPGVTGPPPGVSLAAALASVRRVPTAQTSWVDQRPVRTTEPPGIEVDNAFSRANRAGALAAKEYLDHRATPAGHQAYEKERQERNWTRVEHSRLRGAALAGQRVATAAHLTSVRGVGRAGRPVSLPTLGSPRRRQVRAR
ncbi:hypothetical protein QQG74_14210 [Micromonospora sp. FIMYZ51]|uniref:hypothetical protein n=1 Tax=Micromonospora sp. FIMYZ51 TaxID=3051832 RepID=UPI00311DCBF3